MTLSRLLPAAGVGSSLLYGCFFFFDPLRSHVRAFLILTSLLFLIYFVVVWIMKKENGLPAAARGSLWGLVGFSLAFRALMLLSAPSLSDDIYRYLWDGRVQQAGINPFLAAPSSPQVEFLRDPNYLLINHPNIPTVYPPLSQVIFRLGVWIHPSVAVQRALFLFFDTATIFLLMALLTRTGRSPGWVLLYAWNPLVIIEFGGSGHNDSLMIMMLVAGLALFNGKRPAGGTVGLGLGFLSKGIPLIMLPWLFFRRNVLLLFIYVAVIVIGFLPFLKGLDRFPFLAPGFTSYAKDWMFNESVYGILKALWPHPLEIKIFLGVLFTVFSLIWAKRNAEDSLRYCFGALYGLLLISSVVHPWYVIWIVPFLCFFPVWSGLAWSGLVMLTYVVLIRYVKEGVWELPLWVTLVEYSGVYSLLAFEIFKGSKE